MLPILISLISLLAFCDRATAQVSSPSDSSISSSSMPLSGAEPEASSVVTLSTAATGPAFRGVHLTASAAGSKKYRKNRLEPMLAGTIVNALVVDIKEEDGWVYVPGIKMAEEAQAYTPDIPDLANWLAEMKRRNIYTVARIVAFKDNKAPRRFKHLAVQTSNGDLWQDRKHITWLDPYNRDAWKYDFSVALQAAKLGFDEIQFDYIRFPTDGNIKGAKFAKPYSIEAASDALVQFLREARQVLAPTGAKISIDVFGLTTTVNTGMGIGQRLNPMAAEVDFVCPMTYPSHYARGEYGIPNPNDQPYKTIHLAVRDALKTLGPGGAAKLRPYYQDFSLKGRGIRYGAEEVRAQIQAAVDLGVPNWTLWNASCRYTLAALEKPFTPHPVPKALLEQGKKKASKKPANATPKTSSSTVTTPAP